MQPLRIGSVRYLNTAPLIEGLTGLESVQLEAAVPSHLIDLLLSKQVDLALVSIIDAARSPEPLTIVPASMIGCDGPTLTVRLFSTKPIDQISELHADTDSHTSVALARLLLAERFGLSPKVIDFDARERIERPPAGSGDTAEWPDAMLLIGDKVVTDSPPAVRYPHQLDLGEAWHELTGKPFVYATWMCRTSDLDDPQRASAIRAAAAILDRTRRHNATRLEWIVKTHAPRHRWPADLARQYLTDYLRFELGPREREAAEMFVSMCAKRGLAPTAGLKWLDADPSNATGPNTNRPDANGPHATPHAPAADR